jgi:N-acetylglucosaminyldiphosphoundecaprenol N-acetyl-beta-D-mannosaminyltransferase
MEKVRILNLDIQNITFNFLLENLKEGVVFTPNIDHIMKLQKDEEFYRDYIKAEWIVCDGRILQMTSGLVAEKRIQEQITGSDFFPAYCQYHKDNTDEVKIFLLGGTTPEAMEAAKNNINRRANAKVVIGGYSPPFGFHQDEAENEAILKRINESGATVLAVGVGAPKQEKWIMKYKQRLPGIKVIFAIGATIDFQAGLVSRSPKWMTKMGIEWFYRILQEPGRMAKRYLIDDMPYFYLLFLQKIGRYRNPWPDREVEMQGA